MTATGYPQFRYATGPVIDHHCHGLVLRDVDRSGFESLLNEATGAGPFGTTLFDSMAGMAVRRWCAPVLDLEPLADPDAYLRRRRELGSAEVNRRFVMAARLSTMLVDTGYLPEPITSPAELAGLAGAGAHEVLRLESVGEQLLRDGVALSDFSEGVRQALGETTAVATKSIAAYRVGLDLPSVRPSEDELVAALGELRPQPDGAVRIAHPVVNGYLAWAAIEAGRPLQFHVGYGDSDVDLLDCDPLRLTSFLRGTQDHGVPVLLLHNYPFHRHAGYLAQVFDHVFMDVGLAVHNTGALSATVIRESLELVPFAKMLYSSDAFGLSELYYLGSTLFRRGLSAVLERLVDDGELGDADAARVARLVCVENAQRAYALDGPR